MLLFYSAAGCTETILEQFLFVVCKGSTGGTTFVVALMTMYLHIPVDVDPEKILIFALEIVAEVVSVAQNDIGSRPFVDIFELELKRVALVLHDRGHHESSHQKEQLQT